jgi:hypothetical protein
MLSELLTQEKDVNVRWHLADGLAAVAGRLEPARAARVRLEAAQSCLRDVEEETDEALRRRGAESAALLIQPLESEDASRAARAATQRIVANQDLMRTGGGLAGFGGLGGGIGGAPPGVFGGGGLNGPGGGLAGLQGGGFAGISGGSGGSVNYGFDRFLSYAPRPEVRPRAIDIAATVGVSANGAALTLPFLQDAVKPLPCRLTPQDLVEILKMPTCVREVRRVILDQLGTHYGRRFDTHWDFVRYAQQQELGLDFTTPPKRPERKPLSMFQD